MSEKDNSEMCKSCGLRHVVGYVARHGIYLTSLCTKCWRKGETVIANKRNCSMSGWGHHKGAP